MRNRTERLGRALPKKLNLWVSAVGEIIDFYEHFKSRGEADSARISDRGVAFDPLIYQHLSIDDNADPTVHINREGCGLAVIGHDLAGPLYGKHRRRNPRVG